MCLVVEREKGDIVFPGAHFTGWQGKGKARRFSLSLLQRQSHTSATRPASIMERHSLSPWTLSFLPAAKKTRLQQGKQANRHPHTHTHIYIYTPCRKVSSGDRSSTLGRSSTLLPFRFRITLFQPSYRLYSTDGAVHFLSLYSHLHVRPITDLSSLDGCCRLCLTHSVNSLFFFPLSGWKIRKKDSNDIPIPRISQKSDPSEEEERKKKEEFSGDCKL